MRRKNGPKSTRGRSRDNITRKIIPERERERERERDKKKGDFLRIDLAARGRRIFPALRRDCALTDFGVFQWSNWLRR